MNHRKLLFILSTWLLIFSPFGLLSFNLIAENYRECKIENIISSGCIITSYGDVYTMKLNVSIENFYCEAYVWCTNPFPCRSCEDLYIDGRNYTCKSNLVYTVIDDYPRLRIPSIVIGSLLAFLIILYPLIIHFLYVL